MDEKANKNGILLPESLVRMPFCIPALGICVDFQKCVDFWFRLKKCVDLRRFFSFVGLYQSWQGFFVDALLALRPEHFRHQVHHCAVRIKLLCRVTTVIGKFLDQILIALPQLILRAVGDRERKPGEVLQQILQKPIRQAILIGPCAVAKDAGELFAIGFLYSAESVYYRLSHILRHHADGTPMMSFRDDKGMILSKEFCVLAILRFERGGFLIVDIA